MISIKNIKMTTFKVRMRNIDLGSLHWLESCLAIDVWSIFCTDLSNF